MAFWDSHRNAPLPFSVRWAIYSLVGYGALTLGYAVWLGVAVGISGGELILGGVRVGVAVGLAFALLKLQAWARWVAIGGGIVGVVGLLGAGMSLATIGPSAFPLGAVGAGYSLLSTAFLIVGAAQLIRADASAAFSASAPVSA